MPRMMPQQADRSALEALLRASATRGLTPAEAWRQRVSWAYGQLMGCSPQVTREEVEARAVEIYGPCPAP